MSLLCTDIWDHFKSQILSGLPLLKEPNSPEQESNYNQNQSLNNIYKHGRCCRGTVDRRQHFSPTLLITLWSSQTCIIKNENTHTAHIYTASQGRKDMKPPQPAPAGPTKQITYQQYYLQLSNRQTAEQKEWSCTDSIFLLFLLLSSHRLSIKHKTHGALYEESRKARTSVSDSPQKRHHPLPAPDSRRAGECSVATELHVPSTWPCSGTVSAETLLSSVSGEKK